MPLKFPIVPCFDDLTGLQERRIEQVRMRDANLAPILMGNGKNAGRTPRC